MNRYVSEALRRLVSTRAEHLCEYCLIDIADTFFGGEVDHTVSIKHGGPTEAENLAYTCQPCNRNVIDERISILIGVREEHFGFSQLGRGGRGTLPWSRRLVSPGAAP